ncbi:MAG TPA: dTDP-4-dehydrorhamnose reductase [Cellvibrio sp.]|nr:dTDP-4-dehydrorhamnose reductase [Cellvibrio sp.]
MKILLIGGNGQVGFCLNRLLAKADWNYLTLTRAELDIGNASAVNRVVSDYCPDIIINAAAYTAVDKAESEQDEAFAVNATGAKNLAQAANNVDAAIFHISTDYVFAGDAELPYCEADAVSPQSTYGLSKLKGEQDVAAENSRHIILRTAWVFGEHGNNFVKTMIRLGRVRDALGIVGDQLGGPTYAGDIAKVLLEMANQYYKNKTLPWGVYHFSGFPYVSWFEFACAIFEVVGQEKIYNKNIPQLNEISTDDYPTPAKRPVNSRLNCEKVQKNFDIEMSDWRDALKNIKAYS